MCINFIRPWWDLEVYVDSELQIFEKLFHVVVVVNFIRDWRDLQFKVESERQIFAKILHDSFILLPEFLPEIC